MNLGHLDDPNPPVLEPERWQRVQSRSRALARRRRLALTATSGVAIVALILVAAGWVAVGRRGGGDGVVTVGSQSTGASATSTTLDPSRWVTVVLHVDQRTVYQGSPVTGTVVFDNHRTTRLSLPAARPASWQVVVGGGTVQPIVGWLDSNPKQVVDLPPGTTRVPFRAVTQQQAGSCATTGLTVCPPLLANGPARVWFVTDGRVPHLALPAPVAITITNPRGARPPAPIPCPAHSPVPSEATGSYCGPAPHRGTGLGPDGECTGRETVAPCGPGVVSGRYYAYTLPGSCDGRIFFDGRQWDSELPPPTAIPDLYVWMRLDPRGGADFIGPGYVGLRPHTAQTTSNCQPPG